MEINRETGKILEKQLEKPVDFTNPDILAIIDTRFDTITLQINPLYFYGRYQKLERGIPQTKWPCRICRGKGCKACAYTGRLYETSVEELIGKKIIDKTHATSASFHGSGREDIDALMLGTGRPFILEVKNPHIRTVDVSQLEKEINESSLGKIRVSNLKITEKKEIERIKKADFRKVYRILFEGAEPLNKEKLKEAAQILRGTTIRQLTPTRVAHRRAHKLRERKVYNCTIDAIEGTIARVTMETDSGTYVKELISGDEGTTQPNISELIGVSCTVKELDVIEIKGA